MVPGHPVLSFRSIDAGRDDVLRVARLLADRLPDPLRPLAVVAYNTVHDVVVFHRA
jgi:hypothetical protein